RSRLRSRREARGDTDPLHGCAVRRNHAFVVRAFALHRAVGCRSAGIVTARNQRGVALISILLVVALVTALMYHMMTQQSFVVAQTRQVIRADQSLAYALGAEAYARQILFDDWNRPESRLLDTLSEPWAVPSVPF